MTLLLVIISLVTGGGIGYGVALLGIKKLLDSGELIHRPK
mgnify:CR=1 FL=1|jgi:hypothetical protein